MQSPQQPTEVSLWFENVLITFVIFRDGFLRAIFYSGWSGCNQSIFRFSMVWMQPVHFFFSQWSSPFFLFLMVWMQPVHFLFLDGLDATSPYFVSRWSGWNQSIFPFLDGLDATSPFFLFSMVCMQPVHVLFLDDLDATSPFFHFSMVWMQPVYFSFSIFARDSWILQPISIFARDSCISQPISILAMENLMLHFCWPFESQDDWNACCCAATAAAVQMMVSRLGPRLLAASLRFQSSELWLSSTTLPRSAATRITALAGQQCTGRARRCNTV